ncbi:Hydroxyacylglutathione hydrolase OS=Rhodanobacter lindaniclasticus OX=75310 GN=gloB PE=3 SV=1 [Rhodanobacter lindaniclasticus]
MSPDYPGTTLHLVPLPALTDNYIWLLHDDEGQAVVVDPGDAAVVEQALDRRQWRLRGVLLTHHHNDHIGGAAALRQHHGVPVYGPLDPRIDCLTHVVGDGDRVTLTAPELTFEVLSIPGHTRTHIGYVGAGLVLCGDTLFSLGCGRLFEGTPAQMLDSLDRLAALPGSTRVCAGHEYTQANGLFANEVEPNNPTLQQRRREVARLRADGQASLPVTLAAEQATNPFLRVDTDAVIDWCARRGVDGDRVARFAALRAAKDVFRA